MKDKGIFANQLKSVIGAGTDDEIGESVFSLASIDDRIETTLFVKKKRPKHRRSSLSIKVLRKDLAVPMRKKAELSFAEAMRRQMARGTLSVVYHDSISLTRDIKRRTLKGNTATSARRRKRLVDFAAKKTKLTSVQFGGKPYVKPVGTRRQKWAIRQAERVKEAEAISATIHNLPVGSYSRSAPTELGGYLTKTTGPMSTGDRIMTEEEAAMDERMRYAEATGQYDPCDKEVDE